MDKSIEREIARAKEIRRLANEQANAIEAIAVRSVLERHNWFVNPTASDLGWSVSTLARALASGGIFAALGREAAAKRAAMGYSGRGNPLLSGVPTAPKLAMGRKAGK